MEDYYNATGVWEKDCETRWGKPGYGEGKLWVEIEIGKKWTGV